MENKAAFATDVVDLGSQYSVHQWTEILDISETELADAVEAVGTNSCDIKQHVRELRQRRVSAQND